MLTIEKTGPNRIELTLSGTLNAATMRAGLDDLLTTSEGVTSGRLLYRIEAFNLPTLGAIAAELMRLPELFGLLNRFDRCAVLCDIEWIRRMAEVEGKVLPGLTIRSFPLSADVAAEAWLDDQD